MTADVSRIDAGPLLQALTIVRDEARTARERPSTEVEVFEIFLKVGAKAHQALMWFEADQAGDFESARRWLDQLFSGLPSRQRLPVSPEPPT